MKNIAEESHQLLNEWVNSCTRGGKVSRNTVAVGIVILDHLRRKCPRSRDEVVSQGGEIKGARSGLGIILESYGIPSRYLKEVTTRQGHQDGQRLFEKFDWGNKFLSLSENQRENLILGLAEILTEKATTWLKRQNLKLAINRRHAPMAWVNLIIQHAKQRSGGVVEQHLIGAKLTRRFRNISIPNYPVHAADRQTSREGDFTLSKIVYHVTAIPSRNVIQKCDGNIQIGLHPILLVPSNQEYKAKALAQDEGIDNDLTIISIEDFVGQNIIELAIEESKDFFVILQEIIQIYNKRLAEVETDLSLQIELR